MLSPNLPYIKYPEPQNAEITFQNSITCPISSVVDNRFATTSYVNSFWTALRTAMNTWSGKQTFDELLSSQNIGSPITTFTVGTETNDNVHIYTHPGRTAVLNVGNGDGPSTAIRIGFGTSSSNDVNILNGTGSTGTITLGSSTIPAINIHCPLTPKYSYPVTSSTKIGYIAPVTFISDTMGSGGGVGLNLRSVSLTQGTWFLAGTISSSANATSSALSFNSFGHAKKGVWQYGAGQPAYPWGITTCIVLYVSTTGTYYLTARCDGGGTATNVNFTAMRIG